MDLCRAKGVAVYEGVIPGMHEATCKLVFGPPPAPPKAKKEEVDPQARKREHYKMMLGRDHIEDEELKMLPDSF
jgi:hypothetical protein